LRAGLLADEGQQVFVLATGWRFSHAANLFNSENNSFILEKESDMPLPRARIVVLISHLQRPSQQSRLAQVVGGLMGDYSDETSIQVLDTSVEEALQVARELERRGEVDVFVCAGATAAYLRKHLTRPVLSMRIGGADLLRALEQARQEKRRLLAQLQAGDVQVLHLYEPAA